MSLVNQFAAIALLTAFYGYTVGRTTAKVPRANQVSGLWIEKFTEYLRVIDVNNDGLVSKEEFVDEVALRAQRVLPSWRAKAVYGLMNRAWRYWLKGDTQPLNLEKWLRLFETDLLNATLNDLTSYWCLNWFHILDEDCDEAMSVGEYSNLLEITRNVLPPGELFNIIDHNQNNMISMEEFLHGCEHFYYDMKDKKAALFYGSPVLLEIK